MADRRFQPETLAIHAGQIPDAGHRRAGAADLPDHQLRLRLAPTTRPSLFNLQTFGNVYSRLSNPTVAALEERVAALEGGRAALASRQRHGGRGDGAADASAAPATTSSPPATLYGGTRDACSPSTWRSSASRPPSSIRRDPRTSPRRCGRTPRRVTPRRSATRSSTWSTSRPWPTIAHEHGVPLVVDNTVPSPYLCNPIEFGADIVVHSATKYIGGHGTTMGGVMVESGKFHWGNGKFPEMTEPSPGYHGVIFHETFGDFGYTMQARMETLRIFGAALSPMNAWLILQGVETLHAAHGAALRAMRSRWRSSCRTHPRVELGELPGPARHPQYALGEEIVPSTACGRSGCSTSASRAARGRRALHRGGAVHEPPRQHRRRARRSSSIPPRPRTARCDEDADSRAGVAPDMVRMSVGLETLDDILWDIDQALSCADYALRRDHVQPALMSGQRILVTGGGTGSARRWPSSSWPRRRRRDLGRRKAVCDATAEAWRAQFPSAASTPSASTSAMRRTSRRWSRRCGGGGLPASSTTPRQLHRADREPVAARLRRRRQHRLPRHLLRHAGGRQALGRRGGAPAPGSRGAPIAA